MAKSKTMVLVFGFSFPFLPVSKDEVVLVSGKSGFIFGFSFCPREGLGVRLPPLIWIIHRVGYAASTDLKWRMLPSAASVVTNYLLLRLSLGAGLQHPCSANGQPLASWTLYTLLAGKLQHQKIAQARFRTQSLSGADTTPPLSRSRV